jgi:hypothetical protein
MTTSVLAFTSYIATERSLDISWKGGFTLIALDESLKANGVSCPSPVTIEHEG